MVDLPVQVDDVFEAARAPAEGSGRPLGAVLSHLVRWGLRCAPEFANRNGLPVFKVPPDAKIIPAGRASELLAG